jgi:hypothetical protein
VKRATDAIEARRMAAGTMAGGGAAEDRLGNVAFTFALAKRDEVRGDDHECSPEAVADVILILDDIDICQYSAES